MARTLREDYRQLLTGGGGVAILAFSLFAPQVFIATASAALAAGLAFFAWVDCYRRGRVVADTPTSLIASAAQGYVELNGVARPLSDRPLCAPLSGAPCVWYRYRAERYGGSDWALEEEGESASPFLIEDASGACAIVPEGAEMTGLSPTVWYNDDTDGAGGWRRLARGDRRKTEWLLREGEAVHAVGSFVTRSEDPRDPAGAAERHQLRKPGDGRPFLVRVGEDGEAAGRASYGRWALVHLLVFVLALASLPHALGKPWGL